MEIMLTQGKEYLRLPGKDPFLEVLEGMWPLQNLDFGLQASKTVRKQISVVLSHSNFW